MKTTLLLAALHFSPRTWFVYGLIGLLCLTPLLLSLLPLRKVPIIYNLRNLQVRWWTTALTLGAFVMVIAILVVMLAFVNGMQRLTDSSGHPGNVLILSDGATDEAFSNLPSNITIEVLPDDLQKRVALDPQTQKRLATREVFVIATHELPGGPGDRRRRFVQMRGIDDPFIAAQVHDIELEPGGSWWSPGGVRELILPGKSEKTSAYEVVLGDGVAKAFGGDRGGKAIQGGEFLQIGPFACYVVGVMQPNGSTFGSEVWLKDEYVKKAFGKESYSSYVVRAANTADAPRAVQAVKEYRGASLVALREQEYYAKLNQTNEQFLIAFIFVAVIMSIGGVLGVMNTMFAAISQRSKDIGVLRLIGYSRPQILLSFLSESLVIALLGGLLGCGLGFLADGWTATSIISSGAGGGKSVVLRLTVDTTILAFAMGFAIIMGAIGGIIPSLSAMRLRPLESLR